MDDVAPTTIVSLADQADIVDALLRFANGMDTDDRMLIASAFTVDGVADFTPAASRLGIRFPVLEGRDDVSDGLAAFAAPLTTSHSVSNVRVDLAGDRASVYALVEAQHLPVEDHSRHLLMKNRYDIDAGRDAGTWRIERMTIDNLWWNGDLSVVSG